MKFTLAVVALVFGRADAALRNSNAPSNEGESNHDTPKPAEDTHSFLSENGSSTTACARKCVGTYACVDPNCDLGTEPCTGVDQSKVGCGGCVGTMACTRYTGDSIGENSCFKSASCTDASAIIGKNSCDDDGACIGASGYIGDNQCNSYNECALKHFPALSLYKDVLTGNCRSILGKQYSDVRIATTYLRENNPEACAQFCRQPSLNNGFQVGMQFGNDKCFCKYDGSSELPSLVPDGAVKRVTTDGYGPVSHGGKSANPGVTCYPLKHVDVDHYSLNEPTLTID